MEPEPSERVIDQRRRNRFIEALEYLAQGDDGVRLQGLTEYLEGFYDFVRHRRQGGLSPNTAMNAEEWVLAQDITNLMHSAYDEPASDDAAFIATGWPKRIQPVALQALKIMLERGKFDEEIEEREPSDLARCRTS